MQYKEQGSNWNSGRREVMKAVALFGAGGCATTKMAALPPGLKSEPTARGQRPKGLDGRRLGPIYDLSPDVMHYVFCNMTEFYPHAVVSRDGAVPRLDILAAPDDTIMDWTFSVEGETPRLGTIIERELDAIVILKAGSVIFERYLRMEPGDRHLLMSVTKAVISYVIAILVDRGLIDPRASIDRYIPRLVDSAWRGLSVISILNMTSGMDAREHVTGAIEDPSNPYYPFEASLGYLGGDWSTSTYEIVAGMKRRIPQGMLYEYSSVNTFVLGWLAESVTSRRLNEVISDLIWKRLPMESDAFLLSSPTGAFAADGGLSCTLRDLARFGDSFTRRFRAASRSTIVSERHLRYIQTEGNRTAYIASLKERGAIAATGVTNSWHWDLVWNDGDFLKHGWGGQCLYVSPARNLVIAYLSTSGKGMPQQMRNVVRPLGLRVP